MNSWLVAQSLSCLETGRTNRTPGVVHVGTQGVLQSSSAAGTTPATEGDPDDCLLPEVIPNPAGLIPNRIAVTLIIVVRAASITCCIASYSRTATATTAHRSGFGARDCSLLGDVQISRLTEWRSVLLPSRGSASFVKAWAWTNPVLWSYWLPGTRLSTISSDATGSRLWSEYWSEPPCQYTRDLGSN